MIGENLPKKIKAVGASHPDRTVLADILFRPITRGARSAHRARSSEERAYQRRRAEQAGKERALYLVLCSNTVASGQSCRLWRTLGGGRNARATITHSCSPLRILGYPIRRRYESEMRFWRTLPTIHPRESSGSAGSAVMPFQGFTEHLACLESTLLEVRASFKNNPARVCEQPVNAANFLWKAMEKMEEILRAE